MKKFKLSLNIEANTYEELKYLIHLAKSNVERSKDTVESDNSIKLSTITADGEYNLGITKTQCTDILSQIDTDKLISYIIEKLSNVEIGYSVGDSMDTYEAFGSATNLDAVRQNVLNVCTKQFESVSDFIEVINTIAVEFDIDSSDEDTHITIDKYVPLEDVVCVYAKDFLK